jgi:thiol:disulfide interchange protein DsbC
MTLRKFDLLLLAPLLVTSASFAANPQKPAISEIAEGLLSIKIDGMQDLPITGLKMVKTGEQTVFISSNGRFALTGGKLMDIWRLRLGSMYK